jgi:hypothetical protein
MKRLTAAALAAATLISATAIAETLAQVETASSTNRQTAARTSSDERAGYVPSLNFGIQTQAAFVLPY